MSRFAYYVIQFNGHHQRRYFHMSDGMQEVYSKMLDVVPILFLESWVRKFNPQTLSCGS